MSKLRDLQELLLDETRWPADFKWDYADARTCAIGLARATGMATKLGAIHKSMRISEKESNSIFFAHQDNDKVMRAVTPQRVAFYISKVLNDK
jgi:hypothetical protein